MQAEAAAPPEDSLLAAGHQRRPSTRRVGRRGDCQHRRSRQWSRQTWTSTWGPFHATPSWHDPTTGGTTGCACAPTAPRALNDRPQYLPGVMRGDGITVPESRRPPTGVCPGSWYAGGAIRLLLLLLSLSLLLAVEAKIVLWLHKAPHILAENSSLRLGHVARRALSRTIRRMWDQNR